MESQTKLKQLILELFQTHMRKQHFAGGIDQDQTAQNVQSDLDLYDLHERVKKIVILIVEFVIS